MACCTVVLGEIDRDALGKIVFNDVDARRKLNKATHLPVFVEMFRQLFCSWLSCERVVVRHLRVVPSYICLYCSCTLWRL